MPNVEAKARPRSASTSSAPATSSKRSSIAHGDAVHGTDEGGGAAADHAEFDAGLAHVLSSTDAEQPAIGGGIGATLGKIIEGMFGDADDVVRDEGRRLRRRHPRDASGRHSHSSTAQPGKSYCAILEKMEEKST